MGRLRDIESQDEQDSHCQPWTSLFVWCAFSYLCMVAIFISVCLPDLSLLKLGLLPVFVRGSSLTLFYAFSPHAAGHFAKPKGFDIVALVPFHLRQRTEILDCYLQRNLAHNNGLLDQVVFIPQTNDTESLEWLSSMVERTSAYRISHTNSLLSEAQATDKNTLFVWIDGDIVFLEDHTIQTMVKTKLDHPESVIVSANVVNQAILKALHSHPSVALPYRPELYPVTPSVDQEGWRASALPPWKGPADFKIQKGFSPPPLPHRWLPSSDSDFDLTPIGSSVYSNDGPGFDHWTVSAQQHYSFLHHLEVGDLYRYKFPLWTNPAKPISHDFFCFHSPDAANVQSYFKHGSSREKDPAVTERAESMNRRVIIDGKGLAAHYFTGRSLGGLEQTDVLHRYQAYAKEMVCPMTP